MGKSTSEKNCDWKEEKHDCRVATGANLPQITMSIPLVTKVWWQLAMMLYPVELVEETNIQPSMNYKTILCIPIQYTYRIE